MSNPELIVIMLGMLILIIILMVIFSETYMRNYPIEHKQQKRKQKRKQKSPELEKDMVFIVTEELHLYLCENSGWGFSNFDIGDIAKIYGFLSDGSVAIEHSGYQEVAPTYLVIQAREEYKIDSNNRRVYDTVEEAKAIRR